MPLRVVLPLPLRHCQAVTRNGAFSMKTGMVEVDRASELGVTMHDGGQATEGLTKPRNTADAQGSVSTALIVSNNKIHSVSLTPGSPSTLSGVQALRKRAG